MEERDHGRKERKRDKRREGREREKESIQLKTCSHRNL